jgi:RNA polymerase sigma-70 factor (ECF subfamily)
MSRADAAEALTRVWRREAPRVIGRLARILGDLALAEEFAQDALVAALGRWPETGVPDNPGAWLMTTAKNRALNALRRGKFMVDLPRAAIDERPSDAAFAEVEAALASSIDDGIDDDVLRLLFIACHPLLPREARVALTLRTVAGLSTAEIARAFLAQEPTIAQRIVRAKRTLGDAGVPFELPRDDLDTRLASVLEVVYLVFNEGYAASAGDDVLRGDLCDEAIRLGELLARLAPDEPEVHGLLALMCLHASRAATRVDVDGEAVLLADQDRTRWDADLIARGLAALEQARGSAGVYVLQAELAACHARAATFEDTDWPRIVALYDRLAALAPSPVIALNRAIAISRAEGPAAGLAELDALHDAPALQRYPLLPGARADLLARLGRHLEAAAEYDRAAALCSNARQRDRLTARAKASRALARA